MTDAGDLASPAQAAKMQELRGLRVLAESRPAGDKGGDFFSITPRASGRVAVLVGDACGRGPDGAALVPTILPMVDELARSNVRPGRMLEELNHDARYALPLDRFITLLVLEIDTVSAKVVLASAGHVPLLVRRAAGDVGVVGRASGPPLRMQRGARYVEEQLSLGHGDLVVLMTDGLLEAVETDLAAMPGLLALLRAPGDVGAVHSRILAAFDRSPPDRRTDDVTLLSIEIDSGVAGNVARLRPTSSPCA